MIIAVFIGFLAVVYLVVGVMVADIIDHCHGGIGNRKFAKIVIWWAPYVRHTPRDRISDYEITYCNRCGTKHMLIDPCPVKVKAIEHVTVLEEYDDLTCLVADEMGKFTVNAVALEIAVTDFASYKVWRKINMLESYSK